MDKSLEAAELAGGQPQTQAIEVERPRKRFPLVKIFVYFVLIAGAITALFPFAWMVSASFMSVGEINSGQLLPGELRIENYIEALELANFLHFEILTDADTGAFQGFQISGYVWNSLRITAITIVGSLIVCVPAAYAFARMKFFGRDVIFAVMLATMMIPAIVMLIPHLLTVIWLGRLSEAIFGDAGQWFNNWPALTIPFFASAFNIFLLRQFFAQIPEDLWDAVRIDGGGHLRFLWSVVMPLSKAPIMTVITLEFIGSWNSLMWPLIVTNSDDWRPVAVGLTNFVTGEAPGDLHLQMAASVMMIIPILVIYFFTQKQFTEGIAQSGLKG